MEAIYTGSGAYCYSDSLHMSLLGAGADTGEPPEPGFLECLTTLPFGNAYRRAESAQEGPTVFFDGCDPDQGLQRAMSALGWACDEWHGTDADADGEEALDRLRGAVEQGPALVGPLDMGHLPYNPDAPQGADHFVAALGVDGDRVLLHDPAGFPCAVLATDELLTAWRADAVPYKRGPYTLRGAFRRTEEVGRREAISRTLPLIRENVAVDPGGPVVYGGAPALRLLAGDLRGEVPRPLSGNLTHFALPLAARRSLDAASFLREADKAKAAENMRRQALLFGEAQYLAVRGHWPEVAGIVELIADTEDDLAAALADMG